MFAQEDYSIAGGDGTGTPQEELTELTVELTDFDNGLAQKEDYPIAGGDLTGTPQEELTEIVREHIDRANKYLIDTEYTVKLARTALYALS